MANIGINNSIDKLIGKKVLFFDLETTGFPKRKNGNMPGGYADYYDNSMYDTSRILQIGWYYFENFNKNFDIGIDMVRSVIRKPHNFHSIPDETIKIHGITYDRAIKEGVYIKKILNGEFGNQLMCCDYLVAYNAYFDFSILANEIHRANRNDLYKRMLELRDGNVVCCMVAGRQFTGKTYSQETLYRKLYDVDPPKQHDAKNDVYTMIGVVKYIMNNPQMVCKDIKHINNGNPWNEKEDKKLKKLYIDDNLDIEDISTQHGRTKGGITSRLKRLNILKVCDKYRTIEKDCKNVSDAPKDITQLIKDLRDEMNGMKKKCDDIMCHLEKIIKLANNN